jgi:hypothetical protein
MDQHVLEVVQKAASVLSGVVVFAALLLLWWKSYSPWLLMALLGEGVSLLFRLAFAVAPGALSANPMMLLVWPFTGLLVAAGLLGYAVIEASRPTKSS